MVSETAVEPVVAEADHDTDVVETSIIPCLSVVDHIASSYANSSDHNESSGDWEHEEDKEGSEISASLVNELQEKPVVEEQEAEEKLKKILMLEFKKLCSSCEVRWRALAMVHPDPFIEKYLRTMLNDVRTLGVSPWDTIWEPMLTPWRKNAASTSAKTYALCFFFRAMLVLDLCKSQRGVSLVTIPCCKKSNMSSARCRTSPWRNSKDLLMTVLPRAIKQSRDF